MSDENGHAWATEASVVAQGRRLEALESRSQAEWSAIQRTESGVNRLTVSSQLQGGYIADLMIEVKDVKKLIRALVVHLGVKL